MFPTGDILARPTLVLNRSWQPIHVTTVVRALVMLWNESARVVDPEHYRLYSWADWMALPAVEGLPCIRTARARIRVPGLVARQHFDGPPPAAVGFTRRSVATRAHFTCQDGSAQPGVAGLTVDHVVPRAASGRSSRSDGLAACADWNTRTAFRTSEQIGTWLRKAPARA